MVGHKGFVAMAYHPREHVVRLASFEPVGSRRDVPLMVCRFDGDAAEYPASACSIPSDVVFIALCRTPDYTPRKIQ